MRAFGATSLAMSQASLPSELGRHVRAARKLKGLSIRAVAEKLGCSPRFVHELEHGKPTARMDKVIQALAGLGMELEVRGIRGESDPQASRPRSIEQVQARAQQGLYEERLAGAHARLAALLALDLVDHGDLERARGQVRKWAEARICSQWYVDQWTSLLTGSGPQIASNILALGGDDARALFQNTPFGFLVRDYLRR